MLEQVKKNWDSIFQASVWLASTILLAVSSPPRFLAGGLSNSVVTATELILAICVAIAFFIFKHTESSINRTRYVIVGVVFLICAIVSYMVYEYQFAAWTCSYDGRGPVTVGLSFTPDAANYVSLHPETNCEYLIQVYGGQVEKIWPRSELINRHLTMIATFVLSVVSFALSALFATFALTSASKEPAGVSDV